MEIITTVKDIIVKALAHVLKCKQLLLKLLFHLEPSGDCYPQLSAKLGRWYKKKNIFFFTFDFLQHIKSFFWH